MKLEHFGMAEPGDCRVVFSATAEELEAAVQAEKAAPDAPQDEDDLLTAAVNRAILEELLASVRPADERKRFAARHRPGF